MSGYRGIQSPAPSAYTRLMDAAEHHRPSCTDDDRFVSDDAPVAILATICGDCPVLALCAEYATKAKPAGGVWAGRRYGSVNHKAGRPKARAA